jgi:hypothetical protein
MFLMDMMNAVARGDLCLSKISLVVSALQTDRAHTGLINSSTPLRGFLRDYPFVDEADDHKKQDKSQ